MKEELVRTVLPQRTQSESMSNPSGREVEQLTAGTVGHSLGKCNVVMFTEHPD